MSKNNNFDLNRLVRPNIQVLKPYRSARDDFEQGILLDANENSQGAPASHLQGLHRYPSPSQKQLRQKIAAYRGVQPSQVFVGNGSDEAIDILYRIFCQPGEDRVLISPPTFGMYKVAANIHSIEADTVLLDEQFGLQVDKLMQKVTAQTKLLFLCSPNNPTGNVLDREDVLQLINQFPGIVVVDEAYIDFSEQPSFAASVQDHPNLVVLQTLSKAFGLAGARLGMAIASREIISYMMKTKAPYNVNALTSKAALDAFDHLDAVKRSIEEIKKERKQLRKELAALPAVLHIYPSDTNFLLVKIKQARAVYTALAKQNIIVRYRGHEPGCSQCLRITVGSRQENTQLINALKNITHETLD